MPKILLMPEVAVVVRAPTDTLRYWRSIGSGPPSFKLGRRVVYREEDVYSWIAEQAAKAT